MKLNFFTGLIIGALVSAILIISIFSLQGNEQSDTDFSQGSNPSIQINKNSGQEKPPESSREEPNDLASSEGALNSKSQPNSDDMRFKTVMPNTDNSAYCDELCVNNLTSKLVDGARLSTVDWDNIRGSSDDIAASISSDPDAISALRDMISYSNEQDEIDGYLSLVSSLPDDQALDILKDVSNYSNTHKVLALQTLSGLSLYSKNAGKEIESLIIGEREPEVLAAALNAIENIDNHDFSPQTWQSLSAQLDYVEDTQLKSSILMSLAKHGKGDPVALKGNVEDGLNSESIDLQMASIEALRYLMSRSENDGIFASAASSDGLKFQLNAIVGNSDSDTSLRVEALRLLEEAF